MPPILTYMEAEMTSECKYGAVRCPKTGLHILESRESGCVEGRGRDMDLTGQPLIAGWLYVVEWEE